MHRPAAEVTVYYNSFSFYYKRSEGIRRLTVAPEPTVVVTVTGAPVAAGVVVTVTVTVSVIYVIVSSCNQESTLS